MKHKIITYFIVLSTIGLCTTAQAELFKSQDRSAYLVKGSTQNPTGDKADALNKNPLEELNWIRKKAATEETKRRKLEVDLKKTKKELEKIKQENTTLTHQITDLKKNYQTLQYAGAPTLNGTAKAPVPYFLKQGYYEVVEGESLWKIAKRADVFDNPLKWIELYYANKEKVDDPDMIYPGQVLVIPDYYIVPDVTEEEPTQTTTTTNDQQ